MTAAGSSYRAVDEFSNAQISAAYTNYTLRQVDEMNMQFGGTLKLQRCE